MSAEIDKNILESISRAAYMQAEPKAEPHLLPTKSTEQAPHFVSHHMTEKGRQREEQTQNLLNLYMQRHK